MTTLLFARHGQASFGQPNYDKLSSLGIHQAQLLGEHYRITQRRIDAVITGTLERQKDSAKHFLDRYLSQNLQGEAMTSVQSKNIFNQVTGSVLVAEKKFENVTLPATHIIPGFNEYDHVDILKKSHPDFRSKLGVLNALMDAPVPKVRLAELFYEAMERWHSGEHDNDYTESWSQFNTRVHQALQAVIEYATNKEDYQTVLIFTSGGVISAITARLLNQGSQTALSINRNLLNTGVTSVLLKGGEPKLLSLNEYSHLYEAGLSYLTAH